LKHVLEAYRPLLMKMVIDSITMALVATLWCPSDVWFGLLATYVDYYAFLHQIFLILGCFHVWFHCYNFLS
jgi:hypothetical protein